MLSDILRTVKNAVGCAEQPEKGHLGEFVFLILNSVKIK